MSNPRILVIGAANMELSLQMPRFPSVGETLQSEGTFRFAPGGRGGVSAVAAARLGCDVLFCTRIGNDLNGRTLKEYYDRCGVDTRFLKLDRNRPTPLCETVTEKGQKQRVILFPGAGAALNEDDIEDAFMAYPDGLLLQFDLSEYLFVHAAELAQELSIPVFADATKPNFDYPHSMPRLEVMVLGEAETYAYTDIFPDCLDDYVRACMRLSSKINAHYFVIRLHGRGAYITDGKYSEIVSMPEVAGDVSDAPDAFCAALAAEYLSSKKIVDAVKLANSVGAYLSLNRGAADPYPTRKQLQSFKISYGVK